MKTVLGGAFGARAFGLLEARNAGAAAGGWDKFEGAFAGPGGVRLVTWETEKFLKDRFFIRGVW